MRVQEVNFDGLVGATHNYAGLSFGNVASAASKGRSSNPKKGALQGLKKMRHMRELGLTQGVLPPHQRPHLPTLRALGFQGTDIQILTQAYETSPELVANLSSSSTMWTANAATVTPFCDTRDGKTHFTPANLAAMYHRSIEPLTTGRILRATFSNDDRFVHHPHIPGGIHMGDEGAANHNRFCSDYGNSGVAVFVYGREAFGRSDDLQFPGRQTKESCRAVLTQHSVASERMILVRQNPKAINAGAFHNDVVSVCNKNVFFFHEEAFENTSSLCAEIQSAMGNTSMEFIKVPANEVSLSDAVSTYLFNSQLVSAPTREGMTLILPSEAKDNKVTRTYIERLLGSDNSINHADFFDLRQSMRNGGGPACLRLRVVLSDEDLLAMGSRSILNDDLYDELVFWVEKHYRESVEPEDLCDPQLMMENFAALDELTQILNLGSIYDFQRNDSSSD